MATPTSETASEADTIPPENTPPSVSPDELALRVVQVEQEIAEIEQSENALDEDGFLIVGARTPPYDHHKSEHG